jgi:hypothetical protein
LKRIGHGDAYETAIHREFGEPIDRLISEILNFMKRTESSPADRLIGTVYEQFAGT